jgi:hypothetical protein
MHRFACHGVLTGSSLLGDDTERVDGIHQRTVRIEQHRTNRQRSDNGKLHAISVHQRQMVPERQCGDQFNLKTRILGYLRDHHCPWQLAINLRRIASGIAGDTVGSDDSVTGRSSDGVPGQPVIGLFNVQVQRARIRIDAGDFKEICSGPIELREGSALPYAGDDPSAKR